MAYLFRQSAHREYLSAAISFRDNPQRCHCLPNRLFSRKEGDSNPRTGFAGYTLSRRASSATRAPFLDSLGCKSRYFFTNNGRFVTLFTSLTQIGHQSPNRFCLIVKQKDCRKADERGTESDMNVMKCEPNGLMTHSG